MAKSSRRNIGTNIRAGGGTPIRTSKKRTAILWKVGKQLFRTKQKALKAAKKRGIKKIFRITKSN